MRPWVDFCDAIVGSVGMGDAGVGGAGVGGEGVRGSDGLVQTWVLPVRVV